VRAYRCLAFYTLELPIAVGRRATLVPEWIACCPVPPILRFTRCGSLSWRDTASSALEPAETLINMPIAHRFPERKGRLQGDYLTLSSMVSRRTSRTLLSATSRASTPFEPGR
jgi:hypothetical protein